MYIYIHIYGSRRNCDGQVRDLHLLRSANTCACKCSSIPADLTCSHGNNFKQSLVHHAVCAWSFRSQILQVYIMYSQKVYGRTVHAHHVGATAAGNTSTSRYNRGVQQGRPDTTGASRYNRGVQQGRPDTTGAYNRGVQIQQGRTVERRVDLNSENVRKLGGVC